MSSKSIKAVKPTEPARRPLVPGCVRVFKRMRRRSRLLVHEPGSRVVGLAQRLDHLCKIYPVTTNGSQAAVAHGFPIALLELLARSNDSGLILERGCKLICEHWRVSRVVFRQFDSVGVPLASAVQHVHGVRPLSDPDEVEAFDPWTLTAAESGKPQWMADIFHQPNLTRFQKAAYDEAAVRSWLVATVRRGGSERARLVVQHHRVREWSAEDCQSLSLIARVLHLTTTRGPSRSRVRIRNVPPARFSNAISDYRQQDQRDLLLREAQHRARNLVGLVEVLVNRALDESSNPKEIRESLLARLRALSRVQFMLRAEQTGFRELIQRELEAVAPSSARIVLQGSQELVLDSSAAQVLALAVHELATNSLKYGALRQGSLLQISWGTHTDQSGANGVRLRWQEPGVRSAAATAEPRSGFGRSLIEGALPYQFAAQTSYEFTSTGLECTIFLPAS